MSKTDLVKLLTKAVTHASRGEFEEAEKAGTRLIRQLELAGVFTCSQVEIHTKASAKRYADALRILCTKA